MIESIDVHDLKDQDIQFVQNLVDFLREQAKTKMARTEEKDVDESAFTAHPSDVIGEVTRGEIYDYL